MGQVFRAGQINLATLTNQDTYVVVQTPANTQVQGVQTGIVGLVGTASWGPKNVPQLFGSVADFNRMYGASSNATYDMPTDAWIVFGLGAPQVCGVRVTDGTDAASTAALVTASTGSVTIGGTFHVGDTVTVTLGGIATAYVATTADTTLAGVAASLTNALNANPAAAALANFQINGSVVEIVGATSSNTVTLVSAVTGVGATITAVASGANLAGGGLAAGTFTAFYTGAGGNVLTYQFKPNVKSTYAVPLWDLILFQPTPITYSETFTALRGGSLQADIINALTNGQGTSRAPSRLASFVTGANTNLAPPSGAVSFAGGANGDAGLTSFQQMGTNTAIPMTGMYALIGQGVQIFGLSGNTDTTTWTTQLALAQQMGAMCVPSFPTGVTTAAAIATLRSVGLDDYDAAVVKDWVQYLDTNLQIRRLVAPTPFVLGLAASLTPQQSPGNKPINFIIATDRTLANQPYSPAESGQLTAAGIMFITNPVPGGNYFALRHGMNTDTSNPVTNGFEYGRMTNFLAYSFSQAFGPYIDQNQSQRNNDPTRMSAQKSLNDFLHNLVKLGYIDSFNVDMSYGSSGVNTPTTVSDGFMYANITIKYMSVVRFFVITMLGGTNVTVSSSAA